MAIMKGSSDGPWPEKGEMLSIAGNLRRLNGEFVGRTATGYTGSEQ